MSIDSGQNIGEILNMCELALENGMRMRYSNKKKI